MPPTTADLLRDQRLGELVNHRDINLIGYEAPQQLARSEVRTALTGRASQEQVDEAILVANELVGNAIEHTAGPLALTLDIFENGAAVGVVDCGTDVGAVPAAPPTLTICHTDGPVDPETLPLGGRGMFLVTLYSSALSVEKTAGGKLVLALFILSRGDR
ncbi:ATP-binding protein [Streptomyces sp. NPDC048270]|uniref:ATP-binding protein n=1 Tax=Streptomyces sp. NPDC048270 TaxID=3154615 RepID=UPI003401E61D